jgi:hypothetical protein
VPADEGRRIDIGLVDRHDPRRSAVLCGEQGGRAVAGAEVENAAARRQIGEEGAPATGDFSGIIGPSRTVEARRDAVVMPILAPDPHLRQLFPPRARIRIVTGS